MNDNNNNNEWIIEINSSPIQIYTVGGQSFTMNELLEKKDQDIQRMINILQEASKSQAGLIGENFWMQTFLKNILLERRVLRLEQQLQNR